MHSSLFTFLLVAASTAVAAVAPEPLHRRSLTGVVAGTGLVLGAVGLSKAHKARREAREAEERLDRLERVRDDDGVHLVRRASALKKVAIGGALVAGTVGAVKLHRARKEAREARKEASRARETAEDARDDARKARSEARRARDAVDGDDEDEDARPVRRRRRRSRHLVRRASRWTKAAVGAGLAIGTAGLWKANRARQETRVANARIGELEQKQQQQQQRRRDDDDDADNDNAVDVADHDRNSPLRAQLDQANERLSQAMTGEETAKARIGSAQQALDEARADVQRSAREVEHARREVDAAQRAWARRRIAA